jgi:1-deoxy-D-xylulose-5-phosphate synthase
LVAVVEDNGLAGGVGDAVARTLREHGVTTPVRTLGIAQRFIDHATRSQILDDLGLTPSGVAVAVADALRSGTGADSVSVTVHSG